MKKKVVKRKSSLGQIWVETVIYTLIAFAMIGLSLAFIKPKIDEIQDKAVIEQSISILEEMNNVIEELSLKDAGNQRIVEVGISEGEMTIDALNNDLIFELTGEYAYSEPGSSIVVGNVDVLTQQSGEFYTATLSIDYTDYNLKYNNLENSDVLSSSPNPYKILISRQADDSGTPQINIEIIN